MGENTIKVTERKTDKKWQEEKRRISIYSWRFYALEPHLLVRRGDTKRHESNTHTADNCKCKRVAFLRA